MCPKLKTCASKIGRCRGGLDLFRPRVTHTPPSAGKDLTGGPSPGPHAPGFLCPQQRPENSLGHDRHVRRARGLCEELQGLLLGSRGPNSTRSPSLCPGGACGAGQAWPRFCSSACYPWVGDKSPQSLEPRVSCLFVFSLPLSPRWGLETHSAPRLLILLSLSFPSPTHVPEALPSPQNTQNSAGYKCTPCSEAHKSLQPEADVLHWV